MCSNRIIIVSSGDSKGVSGIIMAISSSNYGRIISNSIIRNSNDSTIGGSISIVVIIIISRSCSGTSGCRIASIISNIVPIRISVGIDCTFIFLRCGVYNVFV